MRILCSLSQRPARQRPLFNKMMLTAAGAAAPMLAYQAAAQAQFQPTLPTISPLDFNVTEANGGVSGASIDGGATAGTGSSVNNTTVLQDFINYASTATTLVNGVTVTGGTVELPAAAAAYFTKTLTIDSDVNLEIDSGATLENSSNLTTLITTSGNISNVAITGGGILNNNAGNSTSNDNMLALSNITNLLVNGVTIENSAHEHLVPENCNNVTINAIKITDSNLTRSNTDGIDYAGTNFLIENSTIADGDDDIVAKPGENTGTDTFCSNILIQNDVITNGHGISIGGETVGGLNNMTVNNITFNSPTLDAVSNGIRLKAGRANGGMVTNVTYNDITMINVGTAIQISSWYVNGSDAWPSANGVSNAAAATNAAVNATTPIWKNITFSNITETNSASNSVIYGVPEAPVQNVVFNNVSLDRALTVNYAGYNGTYSPTLVSGLDVQLINTTLNGTLMVPGSAAAELANSTYFTQSPNGLYQADIAIEGAVVPEPSCGFLLAGGLALDDAQA